MKKSIAIVLAACLLLTGCGAAKPEEPILNQQTQQTTLPTTAPTTVPTDPTTEPTNPVTQPTDPVVPEYEYFNPLTGEGMDAPCTTRPYAVVMDNDKQALPHWNVSKAQMLWEMPHEYGYTRMVAMYTDVSDVTWLGPVRSARTFHVSLAMSFDAVFVHAGYSGYAEQYLKDTGWDHICGVYGKYSGSLFHRDQNRIDAGVPNYQTMYTTGPEIMTYTNKLGIQMDTGSEVDYGYQFAEDGTPVGGTDAKEITVLFKSGGKKSYLSYDESAGCYTMSQHGLAYNDGISGEIAQFENVLVLRADVGLQPGSAYRLAVDLVGSGKGYYACGGKMVPILWSRGSESEPFAYTLEDGTPLTMGVGNTYAAVVYSTSGVVTAE